ncbi:MAG: ABC transporter ATP-binding protein [Angelakisella sp.]
MGKFLIDTRGLCKHYRRGEELVRALDDVSVQIGQGELVAIVGSSGSGKSTLMNLLGCLDSPTAGSYLLAGQDVAGLPPRRLSVIRNAEIGFVFQGFYLMPELTALENVALPLRYRGVGREKRLATAAAALERMGLSDRMGHLPAELSGGQQQRVAIARAIAGEPPLLLADEPTGNLDSASGNAVVELLLALWRQGRTVILITHDPRVAARASRVIEISDGRVRIM